MNELIFCYCNELINTLKSFAFWKDIFIAFIGAFIGFGFSLLLYYRQIRKDEKKKETEAEQKHKNLLVYYEQLIASIIESYNKQLSLVDKFIVKQKEDYVDLQVLERIHTNDFTRIKNIDNIGVFEAWGDFFGSEGEHIKEYKNTNAALDFLEGTLEEIDRIYRINTNQCYDELIIIRGIIENIPDRLAMIALNVANELGEARQNDEWYVFLNESIASYKKLIESEANIHKIETEFLIPFIKTLLSKFKTVSHSGELLDSCKKVRVKLTHVSNEVKNEITEFEKLRGRTLKSLELLNNTKQKINTLN